MSSEKKLVLIILLFLILIFILIFFIIRPSFSEIKNLAEHIKREQKELENLYQKGKTLSQLKDELKTIEEKKAILDSVFLLERKELAFITLLEKMAAKNDILQETILQEKQHFQDEYKTMPVSLSLKGNFLNLVKYLRDLEKLDFYFNIKSLDIKTSAEKEGQLRMDIGASTYWKQP